MLVYIYPPCIFKCDKIVIHHTIPLITKGLLNIIPIYRECVKQKIPRNAKNLELRTMNYLSVINEHYSNSNSSSLKSGVFLIRATSLQSGYKGQ